MLRKAEDGTRTRDLKLGKLAFYQLNYFRKISPDTKFMYSSRRVMVRQFMQVFALLLALSAAQSVSADDTIVDRKAAALFDSVMSPYCPGRTLSACPSDSARELRDDLRLKLEQGYPADELKAELDRRYGDLAGKPTGERSAPLAIVGVMLFFFVGAVLVFRSVTGGEDVKEEN